RGNGEVRRRGERPRRPHELHAVRIGRAVVFYELGKSAALVDDDLALRLIGHRDGDAVDQQLVVRATEGAGRAVVDHRAETVQVLADDVRRHVAGDVERVAA